MCDLPAAPVQGRLGLSEVQAVPGLRGGEPLPEGQLLRHQRRRLRGLLAGVGRAVPFPRHFSNVLKQAFSLGLFHLRTRTAMNPNTPGEGGVGAWRLGIHHWALGALQGGAGAGYK